MFSRITFFAVLGLFFLAAVSVSAQRVKIRKSATGVVSSDREYRGNLSNDEYEISDLINEERRRKGLDDLVWDERLAQIARNYSRKMASESFFSHYDSDGHSVVDRVRNSGVRGWSKIGENLFYCAGYSEIDSLAVRGWMNSPEHRRNILDRQFTATGIGIARSRNGQVYITQVFIRG